jgi:hypothetical protein
MSNSLSSWQLCQKTCLKYILTCYDLFMSPSFLPSFCILFPSLPCAYPVITTPSLPSQLRSLLVKTLNWVAYLSFSSSAIFAEMLCMFLLLYMFFILLYTISTPQCYDPQRPRYSSCTRGQPQPKYQAPYKTRIPLKPTTPIPPTWHHHTNTEKTVTGWPIIQRTRSHRWRGLHHASMSTS